MSRKAQTSINKLLGLRLKYVLVDISSNRIFLSTFTNLMSIECFERMVGPCLVSFRYHSIAANFKFYTRCQNIDKSVCERNSSRLCQYQCNNFKHASRVIGQVTQPKDIPILRDTRNSICMQITKDVTLTINR